MNNQWVDVGSVRLAECRDITKHRVAYAEYVTGVPVEPENLLELDELLKDKLVDTWTARFGDDSCTPSS